MHGPIPVPGPKPATCLLFQRVWARRRGEPYFPRAALSELHTAERWRLQHGREVLPQQLAAPAKLVPKRGHKPEASMDLEASALIYFRV